MKLYIISYNIMLSIFFFQKIADKFLDGEINVEDFIQTFQSHELTEKLKLKN